MTFEIARPERLSRWKIFIKYIFAIPHLVVLYLLNGVRSVLVLIAFFSILFTKRYPRSLFDFTVGVDRWNYRVGAYIMLLTDAYPPFGLAADPSGPAPAFAASAAS